FVLEQTNVDIKLPEAESAKALGKAQDEVIFLNVNDKGQVVLPPIERTEGEPPTLDNAASVKADMDRKARNEFAREKLEKPDLREDDWKPEATVILRVDRETPFEKTYAIMKACREAKYSRVELRAYIGKGKNAP